MRKLLPVMLIMCLIVYVACGNKKTVGTVPSEPAAAPAAVQAPAEPAAEPTARNEWGFEPGPYTAPEGAGPEPVIAGADLPKYDYADEQEYVKRTNRVRHKAKNGQPPTEAEVMDFLKDPDYRIRLLGIEFVTRQSSPAVIDLLLDLMKDDAWWIRDYAGEKLYVVFNETHAANIPECLELVNSTWPSVRANSILALANVADLRILPAIKDRVNDPDGHVRAHTLMALGKQGGEEAVAIVLKAASKPDAHSWVTWYGIDALAAMKAVDALKQLAAPAMKRTYISANLKLLKLGELSLIEQVARIAADENVELRQRSWALSHLKQKEYQGELPELKKEYFGKPDTPAAGGIRPDTYRTIRPWTPRLYASDLGEGRAAIGWSVTADREREYRLERKTGDGAWVTLYTGTAGSFADAGLAAGTAAAYRVVSNDQVSRIVTVNPRAAANPVPELVHVIEDRDHPVTVAIPGMVNWVIEWNIGDLDNDGYIDFMVGQASSRQKRAYTWDGRLLWQRPYTRGSYWTHPVRMAAADLDRDGRSEMVAFEEDGDNKWLVVCDAGTGAVRHYADMNRYTIQQWERRDKILLIDRNASGHEDTIVFIHNNYGNPQAVAFTPELKHLWTYTSDRAKAHKTRIIDLDGDGRDEMILGGDCIDADGRLLWQMPRIACSGHADLVDAMDLDPARPGLEIVAAGCDSDTGWMTDWQGRLLWVQYRGHAQWLAAGRFGAHNEPEVWIRRKEDKDKDDRVALDGTRLGEPPVRGFESTIDWDGDPSNGDEILLWDGSVYQPATGRTLFKVPTKGEGWGGRRAADIIGDSREEIINVDSGTRRIEIYSNPAVNPRPRPDRFDNGWWRFESDEKKPYGRDYINPPS